MLYYLLQCYLPTINKKEEKAEKIIHFPDKHKKAGEGAGEDRK